MKTGDQYPKASELSVLLIGRSGAGKTNTCMQFPNPYFIDTGDSNLKNAIQTHPNKKFFYDTVCTDTVTGANIEASQRWPRMKKLIEENGKNPDIGAVIIDTISFADRHLQRWLVNQQNAVQKCVSIANELQMNVSLWTPYASEMTNLVTSLRGLGKPIVVTSHLKMEKDEVLGTWEGLPTIQGKLQSNFASLFTDYWLCKTEQVPIDAVNPRGVRYVVRTAPDNRLELKTSITGLPPVMTFTWAEFEKYFNK